MGAQEARPGPNGGVFSGFNASRVTRTRSGTTPTGTNFLDVLRRGRGGRFRPSATSATRISTPQDSSGSPISPLSSSRSPRPDRSLQHRSCRASGGDGLHDRQTFPTGRGQRLERLPHSATSSAPRWPNRSLFVTDATPGEAGPSTRVSFADNPKQHGRTQSGYRLSTVTPDRRSTRTSSCPHEHSRSSARGPPHGHADNSSKSGSWARPRVRGSSSRRSVTTSSPEGGRARALLAQADVPGEGPERGYRRLWAVSASRSIRPITKAAHVATLRNGGGGGGVGGGGGRGRGGVGGEGVGTEGRE